MSLPGGEATLDTLWKLSQFAAVTQQAFSGKITDDGDFAFQSSGAAVGMRVEVALSNRRLISLLEQWRGDGYEHPVDHYLRKSLIEQSLKNSEREYLTQLGEKFGFFNDLNTDSLSVEVVSGRAVYEALFGSIPERTNWPDGSNLKREAQNTAAENIVAVQNLEAAMAAADELIKLYKPFITEGESSDGVDESVDENSVK